MRDQRTRRDFIEFQPRQHGLSFAVDQHPVVAFVFLTALYLAVVFTQSSLKLLWLDELITLHLARLSSFHDLWRALAMGADPNPPITYVLVHWSRVLFGDHEFAYRIPSIAGYWIGLASLFAYLKSRVSGSWAIFGCVVSMAMAAFDYSFESRSYAIFYGFAMLAFLCWSIVADSSRSTAGRWFALAGMTLALAAGISTNYFAVLAFLPPAIGEFVRTLVCAGRLTVGSPAEFNRQRLSPRFRLIRTIDLRVWIAFVIAASPLLAYRPLIEHSIAQFAPYAWNKVSIDQVFDSYTEMVEIILYPILGLLVLGGLVFFTKERVLAVCAKCRSQLSLGEIFSPFRGRTPLPPYEAAGVLVFMCYPICGYIIASIRGGMLSPRFVIPVCFGFAVAAAVVGQYLFRNLRHATTIALCLGCAWFLCREAIVGYWYQQQKDSFYNMVNTLEVAEQQMPAHSPIAIPDPLLALTFRHYAPAELAQRVVFPVDFPAVRFFRKDDSPEENLWAGRDFLYELPVVPLATFQHAADRYLVIAGPTNWMVQDLRKHRYPVTHLALDPHADGIGGFTPLAHGVPSFYITHGDQAPPQPGLYRLPPAPFQLSQNLPQAKWYAPPELLNDD
jgi:hypothetical protein